MSPAAKKKAIGGAAAIALLLLLLSGGDDDASSSADPLPGAWPTEPPPYWPNGWKWPPENCGRTLR